MFGRALLVNGVFTRCFAIAITVSKQVDLNGIDYFLPPTPVLALSPWSRTVTNTTDEYVPITVIKTNVSDVTAVTVNNILEVYKTTDDVWSPSFAEALFIDHIGNSTTPSSKWANSSTGRYEYAPKFVLYSSNYRNTSNLPAGPYFLHTYTGSVYQAYRLYADTNQAFIQASYQGPDGIHSNLKGATESAGGLSIAVPSRLYFNPTPQRPLAGVRLAVKDLYDLKGMKTSGGSRALFEITNAANATATAVQKLINAGAIVVGKNKLSQFAIAGQYHLDHIDYLLPFNPRGDGYNSPGDSSGGSAAAVASYDWLDVSIGSDTGGSIRGPALNNGVHGNRPSQGAVDLDGTLPVSTSMDTSGTICRDPELWALVNKVLYSGYAKEFSAFPRKIYTTNFETENLLDSATYYNQFLKNLSSLLGTNTTTLSLDRAWIEKFPVNVTGNQPLATLANSIYGNITKYEQWTEFGKGFIADYRAIHGGELPYITPGTLGSWQAANTTGFAATYQQSVKWKRVVEDFADEIFLPDSRSCSDSILLFPIFQTRFYKADFDPNGVYGEHDANPWVREVFRQRDQLSLQVRQLNATLSRQPNATCSASSPGTPTTNSSTPSSSSTSSPSSVSLPKIHPGRFASVAGLPDYAITIGQLVRPYQQYSYSYRTMELQSLPLGVDIIARRGCDFVVQNIISALHEKGIVKAVKTGSLPY